MSKRPIFLQADPQEIARLYLAGLTARQVAHEVKTTVGRVYGALVTLGVPPRPRGKRKITLEQREEMREDLRSGRFQSMWMIAEKYGLSRERVRQYAASAGITAYSQKVRSLARQEREREAREARAARQVAKEKRREIVGHMWQAGATSADIGRAIGEDPRRVMEIVAYSRTRFPSDFPARREPRSPAERRERKPTALAAQTAREEYDRMARLVTAGLLRIGVSPVEIAGFFGINRDAMDARISRYRKRNPEGFPTARKSRASRP